LNFLFQQSILHKTTLKTLLKGVGDKDLLGIIFTGGEGPSSQVIKRLLQPQVSNLKLLVAADSGLEKAKNAGFNPDWIIGDFDSLDNSCLADYPQERIIRLQCEKDYTDTEMAISLAVEKNCNDIWIIGGGRRRQNRSYFCHSFVV
jgi:thiamine pyrophosphokinase